MMLIIFLITVSFVIKICVHLEKWLTEIWNCISISVFLFQFLDEISYFLKLQREY